MNDQGQDQTRHAGVDWSWQDHAVCVVDQDGEVVERAMVRHSAAGLDKLMRLLRRHQVSGGGD